MVLPHSEPKSLSLYTESYFALWNYTEVSKFHVRVLPIPNRGCPAPTFFPGLIIPLHPLSHMVAYYPIHILHASYTSCLSEVWLPERTMLQVRSTVDYQCLTLQWIWRIPGKSFSTQGGVLFLGFFPFLYIIQILAWINYVSRLLCYK